ncbi:MAG: 3-oxoacyl-ACP reductase FabG [Chlamydiota bacterium]
MLKGKVALITGGNSGIGHSIARKFIENGARVAIIGTNPKRGAEAVEELNALAGTDAAAFYRADVSSNQEVVEAVKKIENDYGKVDILVNNAGITQDALLMKMKEEQWDRVIDVNLKSVYNTCHTLVRSMMKARSGSVINISSVIGLTGNAGQVNYASSKAGMIGFTKAMAREVASRGITVNCIAPGFIETKMTEKLSDNMQQQIKSQVPMNKLGKPEDVANAALFLASDMSEYMTGQVLVVDGGMVM